MNNIHNKNEITFDGNGWNYYVKEIDKSTFNIVYVQKPDFHDYGFICCQPNGHPKEKL